MSKVMRLWCSLRGAMRVSSPVPHRRSTTHTRSSASRDSSCSSLAAASCADAWLMGALSSARLLDVGDLPGRTRSQQCVQLPQESPEALQAPGDRPVGSPPDQPFEGLMDADDVELPGEGLLVWDLPGFCAILLDVGEPRSEEHTSELQ